MTGRIERAKIWLMAKFLGVRMVKRWDPPHRLPRQIPRAELEGGLCPIPPRNRREKPRIKLTGRGSWQCFGDGAGGYGSSPFAAWADWFSDLPMYGVERGEHYAAFCRAVNANLRPNYAKPPAPPSPPKPNEARHG